MRTACSQCCSQWCRYHRTMQQPRVPRRCRRRRSLSLLPLAAVLLAALGAGAADHVVTSLDGFTSVSVSSLTGLPTAVEVNGTRTNLTGTGTGVALSVGGIGPAALGPAAVTPTRGGVKVQQTVTLAGENQTLDILQTFEPAAGGAVAWTVQLEAAPTGMAGPWTPALDVGLAVAGSDAAARSVWLPWDAAQCVVPSSVSAGGPCCDTTFCSGAASPLAPVPVTCVAPSAVLDERPLSPAAAAATAFEYAYGSATSVPLVALLDGPSACPPPGPAVAAAAAQPGTAVVLGLAPVETLIRVAAPKAYTSWVPAPAPAPAPAATAPAAIAAASSSPTAGVYGTTFGFGMRFGPGYRVGKGAAAPVVLRFHIVGAAACPRDVLRRYASVLHPEVFRPPNANVHYRASGMGSYAATQGSLDQPVDGQPLLDTLRDVGYQVNWDATFWWPYIMMLAPTITASANNFTKPWGSAFDSEPGYNNRLSQVRVNASYALRDAYYARWQAANLTVLGYFNGWELGQNMSDYPPPANTCPDDADLWRHAPCFIHKYLDAALCTDAHGGRSVGPAYHGGWDGDTMLDPAHPAHHSFVLTMLQNHLDMEPHFMGVASDGLRACVNFAGDDGVSCVVAGAGSGESAAGGACQPVQDGFMAWASLMNDVGPMLHGRDKLFSANTVNGPRAHLFRHADLIITEQSASDRRLVAVNGWLGLAKPVIMWTTSTQPSASSSSPRAPTTAAGASDLFFQRLLHAGVFPMPPMPSADHSLAPGDASVHQQFLDYGPLFRALQGRSWVLRPHAVSVQLVNNSRSGSGFSDGSGGVVASLAACNASDAAQLWTNATLAGGACPGALASASAEFAGRCLEVQNPRFTPAACATDGTGSHVWVYPCPSPAPAAATLAAASLAAANNTKKVVAAGRTMAALPSLGDCPLHENIRWMFTPSAAAAGGTGMLRSAVPRPGTPSGTLDWGACLAATGAATGDALAITECDEAAAAQLWDVVPAPAEVEQAATAKTGSASFQLRQAAGGQCVSARPPVSRPGPPVVNLFRSERATAGGAETVVVTSVGAVPADGTAVTVVLRCPQPGDDPAVEHPVFCPATTAAAAAAAAAVAAATAATASGPPKVPTPPALEVNVTVLNPGVPQWAPLPPGAVQRLPDQSLAVRLSLVRGAAVARVAVAAAS